MDPPGKIEPPVTRFQIAVVVAPFALTGALATKALACEPVGTLVSVQGDVDVRPREDADWQRARLDEPLCDGATVRVGEKSRALAALADQSKYRLDQNTTLRLVRVRAGQPSLARLLQGAVYFFSRQPRVLKIDTPFVDAAVEGTEFVLAVGLDRTDIRVFEGAVTVGNALGSLHVGSGEAATTLAGEAPRAGLVVRPRDQVQWVLFYPFILLPLADASGLTAQSLGGPLADAVALAARGDTAAAFARFDAIPGSARNAAFHLYEAGALLAVGRVDEARAAIEEALALDDRLAAAWGLRAVIAIAQNDPSLGSADADRAVRLDPRSAAALIARSYAEQARFSVPRARRTLEQAVAYAPDNALAWARLAELWLMLGDRDQALEAARRAHALAPDLEHTQTVLGFAALAAFDTGEAVRAFERAIELDSADPLPRFGRGLAWIRDGRLQAGRLEIETAVALDPGDSLLRSYLGKAFLEENKNALAGEQFARAEALDPEDPTPRFYDALRKQSENRPVEALHDLERSIELNDDRAVYRSRELLDTDRAARGASLARIYDDLGFTRLGIDEATKSLSLDPANASAHRFLADIYVAEPRHELARVSELLQAQSLQDVGIDPVQPSLSQTNLDIAMRGGPAQPGFNEYTPLFERNQAQLIASTEVGNEYTFSDEVVVSGLYGRYALSAGQYYYRTDGFRQNFDLSHRISDVYAQVAVSPQLNVQSEFIRRSTEEGDRSLTFQDRVPLPDRREVNQDLKRIGVRWTPSPQSTLLLSLLNSDFDERQPPIRGEVQQAGSQIEAQYLFRKNVFGVIAGAGAYRVNQTGEVELPDGQISLDEHSGRTNGYVYANVAFPSTLQWTAGLSWDAYDDDTVKRENRRVPFSGKLGARWFLSDDVALRAAVFQTTKPALVASRTLEPTQIAGFDQFYDDPTGTRSTAYGLGLDARLTPSVSVGLEFVRRDLDAPFVDAENGTLHYSAAREDRSDLYAYWAPLDQWAFSAGMRLDCYQGDQNFSDLPSRVRTLSVPLEVRWFSPTGIFAGLGGTWVHQEVDRPQASDLYAEGDDGFLVLDATLGWRLPRRLGMISLQARNLLNSGFRYQDDRYRTFEQQSSVSPFLPARAIVGRVTLNF